MDLEIREIRHEDNAAAASMIRAVFVEHNAKREGTVFSDPTTDALYELFQTEDRSVFYVALLDGQLVGTCGIYPTPGLPSGCAELVKFYLMAEARGKGIGRALMEKSIKAAQSMNFKQLYIESLPEFDKAVNIYQKQGFKSLEKPLSQAHPGCNLWFIKDL